jgi:PKD repeat protein
MNKIYCFFLISGLICYFQTQTAKAQCGNSTWGISTACGNIIANGGLLESQIIFCEGQTITLENNSTPMSEIDTTYVDWGDGYCQKFPGFQSLMMHAYDFPNDTCIISNSDGVLNFNIRLGVKKNCTPNLSSFHWILQPIAVRFKPIALFYATPNVVCVNQNVNINNQSCENSLTPTYLWNFGDGTTSTLENPGTHTYSQPGTYTISLQLGNSCGSDIHSQTITVTPPATALAVPSDTIICAGQNVTFTNQSTNAVGYDWSVTPSTGVQFVAPTNSGSTNPIIKFNNPGTYTVKLEVNGCGDPEWIKIIQVLAPAFVNITPIPDNCAMGNISINPVATVTGTTPTVSWQFPGGSPAVFNGTSPGSISYNTAGTFIVTATATNMCNTSVDKDTFSIAPLATALFTLSDNTLCAPGETLTLTNSSTNAFSSNPYTWSLSPNTGFSYINGTSAASANPQIAFTAGGNYVITLAVNGCGDPVSMNNVQVVAPANVSITTIPDICAQGINTVNPMAAVTGTSPTVSWQFPGGSPSIFNGNSPGAITYPTQGNYIITAVATNSCNTSTDSDTFSIAPQASALFTLSDDTLCAPAETLTITNSSANAFSSNPYSWTITPNTGFSFINGTSATSINPQIAFTVANTYTIQLTVNGCGTPEWEETVTVFLAPNVSISQIPEGCTDIVINPLTYTTFSGGTPVSVSWTFSGGNPANAIGMMPGQVTFSGYGNHFIAVTSTNYCGTMSAVDSFQIFQPQTISLTPVSPLCNTDFPVQLLFTPSGGNWNGPGVSPTGLFTPANALLNVPSSLIYQYGTGDCTVFDTLQILVQGTIVNAGADISLCNNEGILTLSNYTPTGGVWSGTGVAATGVFDPAVAGDGSHLLIYTFTNATTGCVNSDLLEVTVLGIPTAALDSIGRTCVNEPLDFGPFSGGAGISSCQWNFGDGGSSNVCDPIHTYTLAGIYDISLIVVNAAGCQDTATATIEVVLPPNALFDTDIDAGCADLPVILTNSSAQNDYTTYIWNYGNGTGDTIFQPGTVVFLQGQHDTTYTIILLAINGCGEATDMHPVTVFPRPQVNFGTDVSNGCTPLGVNFNNISVGDPDYYEWYINGVLVDTQFQLPQQILVTTDQDSLYFITLFAGNECGTDTVIHTVLVHPNPVHAFFNTDTLIGCEPFQVEFIDYSTEGLYVSWDFGDGNTAVGDTALHTFVSAGEYLVQEYVNNGCGFDTATVNILVHPAPVVAFDHLPYVCTGDTIFFQNQSPAIAGSNWNFGDGTSETTITSPGHIYTIPGFYTVSLTGFAITTGCPETITSEVEVKPLPVPEVMLPDSFGCQPFIIMPVNTTVGTNFYIWDFGDGSTDISEDPVHTYLEEGTYTINLEITDLLGCKNEWTYTPVNVYPKPEADFGVTQPELCVTPTTLFFQNQSIDADAYQWDFGTAGSSVAIDPTLIITSPGNLTVTLVATNQYGCRDTLVRQTTVYSRPELDINVESQVGCDDFQVYFENNSLGVNLFSWDFGDGGTSDLIAPTHVYEEPGTYSVTLYASADSICFDSLHLTDYIQVLPGIIADFSYEEVQDTSIVPNGILEFTDLSNEAISWHWDFGDGGNSAEQNPVHRFYVNGPRIVTLEVTNEHGCSDTIMITIEPNFFGQLYIPNALSPEFGSEGERVFQPTGIGLKEFEIAVYSSDGERVWHSNALENGQPSEFWDGTYKDTLLPQGIYWWKVQARFENGQIWQGMQYGDDRVVREGKVLLIR